MLSGRCYEREATPFKLLDGIVDALFGSIERLVPQARSSLSPLASLFLGLAPEAPATRGNARSMTEPDGRELGEPVRNALTARLRTSGSVIVRVFPRLAGRFQSQPEKQRGERHQGIACSGHVAFDRLGQRSTSPSSSLNGVASRS